MSERWFYIPKPSSTFSNNCHHRRAFQKLICLKMHNWITKSFSANARHPFDRKTYWFDVEGVGSHKGDSILQLIVVHPILVILVGGHGESKGPHAVFAPVGQLHLQWDGVPHFAVHHDITVTKLAVNEDICKSTNNSILCWTPALETVLILIGNLKRKSNLNETQSPWQLILGKKTQRCNVV